MKPGDIIEWRGVNRVHRGKVIINNNSSTFSSQNEAFLCQLDNGKVFPLKDLRHSRSAKLIEV